MTFYKQYKNRNFEAVGSTGFITDFSGTFVTVQNLGTEILGSGQFLAQLIMGTTTHIAQVTVAQSGTFVASDYVNSYLQLNVECALEEKDQIASASVLNLICYNSSGTIAKKTFNIISNEVNNLSVAVPISEIWGTTTAFWVDQTGATTDDTVYISKIYLTEFKD